MNFYEYNFSLCTFLTNKKINRYKDFLFSSATFGRRRKGHQKIQQQRHSEQQLHQIRILRLLRSMLFKWQHERFRRPNNIKTKSEEDRIELIRNVIKDIYYNFFFFIWKCKKWFVNCSKSECIASFIIVFVSKEQAGNIFHLL